MALGGISIVILLAVGWRRYTKRGKKHSWRHRFDKSFGATPPAIVNEKSEDERLEQVRQLEEASHVITPREFDRAPSRVLFDSLSLIDSYQESFSQSRPHMMDVPRSVTSRFSVVSEGSNYSTPETPYGAMPMDAASRFHPAIHNRGRNNML